MKEGPDIARVAALIGDPARANILSALMDGRALTATELATEAGVSKSTTSIHLGKLEAGGLVRPTQQGRHRYFTLSSAEVADVVEALMGLAQRTGATRVRTGPRDDALRHARVCYDHIAGEMGVLLHDGLRERGIVAGPDEDLNLTPKGADMLSTLGIDIESVLRGRRKACRSCLDWSMRRNHLAGALGAELWNHIQLSGWANRTPDSRAIRFTKEGKAAFLETFGPPHE